MSSSQNYVFEIFQLQTLIISKRNLSQRIISGHSEWRDASCVHPNLKGATLADVNKTKGITHVEYVVPNKEQIRQRYLFHLKF